MTRDELYNWFEDFRGEEGLKEARDRLLDAFMLVQQQRDFAINEYAMCYRRPDMAVLAKDSDNLKVKAILETK